MTKKEIAEKHGFINGMSLYSNTETIEQKLYDAMQEYADEQLAIQHVSLSAYMVEAGNDRICVMAESISDACDKLDSKGILEYQFVRSVSFDVMH